MLAQQGVEKKGRDHDVRFFAILPRTQLTLAVHSLCVQDVSLCTVVRRPALRPLLTKLTLLPFPGVIFAPVVTRWYAMLQKIHFESKTAVVLSRVGLE